MSTYRCGIVFLKYDSTEARDCAAFYLDKNSRADFPDSPSDPQAIWINAFDTHLYDCEVRNYGTDALFAQFELEDDGAMENKGQALALTTPQLMLGVDDFEVLYNRWVVWEQGRFVTILEFNLEEQDEDEVMESAETESPLFREILDRRLKRKLIREKSHKKLLLLLAKLWFAHRKGQST